MVAIIYIWALRTFEAVRFFSKRLLRDICVFRYWGTLCARHMGTRDWFK